MKINIITPVIPLFLNESNLISIYENFIIELLALNNILEVQINSIGSYKVKIEYTKDKSFDRDKYFDDIFTFEINVANNHNETNLNFQNEDSEEYKAACYKSILIDSFRNQIFYFLITTQIAKPGTLKTKTGRILINNNYYGSFYSISNIQREGLDYINNIKWPQLQNLDIAFVWHWFVKNDYLFNRNSKTKMELALNAFTHLYAEFDINAEFNLFWSLIGIEALYCSSKEGISEQIFIKTQIILGPLTDFKKKLKQMYNFRSRLIHGDININPVHYVGLTESESKYHEDLIDASILAVSILTATLQYLINENKTELQFKFVQG